MCKFKINGINEINITFNEDSETKEHLITTFNPNKTDTFTAEIYPKYAFEFSTKYDKRYNKMVIDWDKFEDEFLVWYDCGKPNSNFEDITKVSITRFMITEWEEEEELRGDNRRWNCWVDYIFNIKGRYFMMGCDEALTEMQETYYEDDSEITEVEKKIIFKPVNDWVRKETY